MGGRKRHRLGEFFFGPGIGPRPRRSGERTSAGTGRIAPMHLRAPSIDRGVQSFVWALVFFLFLWFGMLAIGISHGDGASLSLVAAFLIFLVVRTRGSDASVGSQIGRPSRAHVRCEREARDQAPRQLRAQHLLRRALAGAVGAAARPARGSGAAGDEVEERCITGGLGRRRPHHESSALGTPADDPSLVDGGLEAPARAGARRRRGLPARRGTPRSSQAPPRRRGRRRRRASFANGTSTCVRDAS